MPPPKNTPTQLIGLKRRVAELIVDKRRPFDKVKVWSGLKANSTIYCTLRMYKDYGDVIGPYAQKPGKRRLITRDDLRYLYDCLELKNTLQLREMVKLLQNN
jgi:hypothetical protein